MKELDAENARLSSLPKRCSGTSLQSKRSQRSGERTVTVGVAASLDAQGLSERQSLRVTDISPSVLRYQPQPDRNIALKEKIIELVQRHRRYGAGMIYLKLW